MIQGETQQQPAVVLSISLIAGVPYEGRDVLPGAVQWCQAHLTPRFPDLRFHHADVRNRSDNAGGKHQASEHRFPFPDDEFNSAPLLSVFAHMLRPGVEQCLSEIARVPGPGGRCFSSWCLCTEHSRQVIKEGRARVRGGSQGS